MDSNGAESGRAGHYAAFKPNRCRLAAGRGRRFADRIRQKLARKTGFGL